MPGSYLTLQGVHTFRIERINLELQARARKVDTELLTFPTFPTFLVFVCTVLGQNEPFRGNGHMSVTPSHQ